MAPVPPVVAPVDVPPPSPVAPPPVTVSTLVVFALELELVMEEAPPAVEPELTVDPVLLVPAFDVAPVVVPALVEWAAGGVAAPVVGTVSGGAPVVLDEPDPPPHAARPRPASATAHVTTSARERRLTLRTLEFMLPSTVSSTASA